jgi:hypothetical protein
LVFTFVFFVGLSFAPGLTLIGTLKVEMEYPSSLKYACGMVKKCSTFCNLGLISFWLKVSV